MASVINALCGLMLLFVFSRGSLGKRESVSVKESESASLTCITEDDERKFQGWYKMVGEGTKTRPDQIVPNNRKLVQSGKLYFVYVEAGDAGVYKCAFNIPGGSLKFTHTTELKVSKANGPEEVKPKLLCITPSTRVRQEDEIKISCVFAGKPIPEITWYYQGKVIAEDIAAVSSRGEGNYTCEGKNTAGIAKGTMFLTRIPLTTSPVTTHSSSSQYVKTRATSSHPLTVNDQTAEGAASTSGACDTHIPTVYLPHLLLITCLTLL